MPALTFPASGKTVSEESWYQIGRSSRVHAVHCSVHPGQYLGEVDDLRESVVWGQTAEEKRREFSRQLAAVPLCPRCQEMVVAFNQERIEAMDGLSPMRGAE